MNQSPYYVRLNIWVQTSDWPTNWYLYQYFQPGKVGSIFLTQWRPNMKIIFWVMGCYFSASHKLCVWPISAVCYRPSMLYSKSRPLVLMIQNDQYFKQVYGYTLYIKDTRITDYGRPIKPFFIEIQTFWAWTDKLQQLYLKNMWTHN